MPGKTKVILLLSAVLLTMCKNYTNESITYGNGLSCRSYVDHRFFESDGGAYRFYITEEGADCTYACPDGTPRQTTIAGSVSPLYAASRDELDVQFCGAAPVPPSTPTAAESATPDGPSATPTSSPTVEVSRTAAVTTQPLLEEIVSMCDLGGKLINFRLLAPALELTAEDLEVQIGSQKSTCYFNPTNPSLLTCRLPNNISFPAQVVVSLEGVVVNDFLYSGVGCAILTTPTPLKNRSYP